MTDDDRKAADIYRDMVRDLIAENALLRDRIAALETALADAGLVQQGQSDASQ